MRTCLAMCPLITSIFSLFISLCQSLSFFLLQPHYQYLHSAMPPPPAHFLRTLTHPFSFDLIRTCDLYRSLYSFYNYLSLSSQLFFSTNRLPLSTDLYLIFKRQPGLFLSIAYLQLFLIIEQHFIPTWSVREVKCIYNISSLSFHFPLFFSLSLIICDCAYLCLSCLVRLFSLII